MIAEIVTIGSELILGQVADTNAVYLSQKLTAIGVDVRYRTAVGDDVEHIQEALRTALRRSELIVTSGGLGPTRSDLTRQAIAQVTGNDLVFREELMEEIASFYRRIRRAPTDADRQQALVPSGAIPIRNPIGTAPGFILKFQGKAIVSLCGVPEEVKQMTTFALIPFVVERAGLETFIFSRILKLTGASEALVERELYALVAETVNPSVGLLVYPGEIQIRLTARGESRQEAEGYLDDLEAVIRRRFGDLIFGVDQDTLESVVAERLRKQKRDLALLEIYTAGRVAQRLVEADPSVIRESRVVGRLDKHQLPTGSEKIALTLARMIREETGADTGVATVSETPQGVPSTDLWVGINSADDEVVTTLLMARSPEVNKQRAVCFTLDQIRRFLAAEIPYRSERVPLRQQT